MPYKSLKEAKKANLPLVTALNNSLPHVNIWSKLFDAVKKENSKGKPADWAKIAWVRFKQKYQKVDGSWKKKG